MGLLELIYAAIAINLVCAILSAVLARRRGYSAARWFIYGVLGGFAIGVVGGPVVLFFAARLRDYRRDW